MLEVEAAPSPDQQAQLEGSILPGDEDLQIRIGPVEKAQLGISLQEILTCSDTAMMPRYQQWKRIKSAYNLYPDSERQGMKPDASRLVSEMTRAQVNIAQARLEESILGVRPFIKFKVWFDGSPDQETQALVQAAKDAEEFFEHYAATDLEVDRWVPDVLHRDSKLGTAVTYVRWKIDERERLVRSDNGRVNTETTRHGRIHVCLVPNENVIVWPLHESEIENMVVVGHRTYYTPAEFRRWAKSINLAAADVESIVATASSPARTPDFISDDLAQKDIRPAGLDPFRGQVEITELWCDLPLPGEGMPKKFQCFIHEKSGADKMVLWVGRWAYHCGRHPYFDFQYWREDGSFWGSGVGLETMYPQAADSALWNLFIDNLKIICNHIRVLKAGSSAEALQDQIGPGYNLVTENPETDINVMALGGDLTNITEAMRVNDQRAVKGTGITPPIQGMGDPVLKSGASPSSLQMLINEANQKFGKVDKNHRRTFARMFAFFLDLIQQYAPDGLFYARAPGEQADVLRRLRYQAPPGDLSRKFRIEVEAPSATSNREVLKQNILIVYQMTLGHAQAAMAMAQQVLAQDPAGLQQFAQQVFDTVNALYAEVIRTHDIPGIVPPETPAMTPEHEQINQLMAQVQQLTQQIQQVQQQAQQQIAQAQQQMQMMMGGMNGQPMGPPGPGPGVPSPLPA